LKTISRSLQLSENNEPTYLYGSGWKSISMVDVYKSVTFTLWLCGCNLKCPFCHNWHLATNDPLYCHPLDVDEIVKRVDATKTLIDYLHITGGEPIVQYKTLKYLLERIRGLYVKISINTNLTLLNPLKKILEKHLVDHIATDLKAPHRILYGYDENTSDKLWELFLEGLGLVKKYGIPLELRIPVPRKLVRMDEYLEDLSKALSRIKDHRGTYIIVQPLLGLPITDPRNKDWCNEFCDPEWRELEYVAEYVKNVTNLQVIIKRYVTL